MRRRPQQPATWMQTWPRRQSLPLSHSSTSGHCSFARFTHRLSPATVIAQKQRGSLVHPWAFSGQRLLLIAGLPLHARSVAAPAGSRPSAATPRAAKPPTRARPTRRRVAPAARVLASRSKFWSPCSRSSTTTGRPSGGPAIVVQVTPSRSVVKTSHAGGFARQGPSFPLDRPRRCDPSPADPARLLARRPLPGQRAADAWSKMTNACPISSLPCMALPLCA